MYCMEIMCCMVILVSAEMTGFHMVPHKGFAEVTADKVNRGTGYGLDISCTYRLYGPKVYTDRMKDTVDS